jgi:hypothetical protein
LLYYGFLRIFMKPRETLCCVFAALLLRMGKSGADADEKAAP